MIDVQSIEHKLKLNYGKVNRVTSEIFRCEKVVNGKPAAIYYFDCTGDLKSAKALVDYQDELIAKDYFSHAGSLQWNYYLTFIVENLLKKDAIKKEIEEDIKYTRKFVIEDSQVEEFIKFSDLDVNNDSDASNNLLGRWIGKLDKANLSGIYQEETRKKVIRDYMGGIKTTGDSQTSKAETIETEKFPYIKALTLENYRAWPQRGTYSCGSVNLITGSNGVGKTSLLEAIEYYFCGKTKRNPDQHINNDSFSLEFKDNEGPKPFKILSTSEYQDRSSQWFRKTTSRGNSLYEGFNQLIFYNTDAAFSLTSSDDHKKIYEAMSSLALGEEANRISKRIEDFAQDFEKEVRNYKNQKQKAKDLRDQELRIVREYKEQRSEQPDEVKALISSLLQKLKIKDFDLESPLSTTIVTRNVRLVLSSISSIRSELNWVPALSIQSIENEITKYKSIQKNAKKHESELSALVANAQAQESMLAKLSVESDTLKQLQKFLKAGYFELNEKLEKSKKENESTVRQLGLLESLDLKAILRLDQTKTTATIVEEVNNAIKDVDKQTKLLDDQLVNISSQVSRLIQLSETIKKMGQDFMDAEPKAIACPLCNTTYPSGELKKRINLLAAKPGDAKGIPELQSNLSKLKIQKQVLQERKNAIITYQKKLQELVRVGLVIDDSKSIYLQLKQIVYAQEKLVNQQAMKQQLEKQYEKLSEKGFNEEKWGLLKSELKLIKRQTKAGSEYSAELIDKVLATIHAEIETCQNALARQKDETEKVKSKFAEALKKTFGPAVSVFNKVKEIDSKLETLIWSLGQVTQLQSTIEVSKKANFSSICTDLKKAEEWLEKLSVLRKIDKDRTTKLEVALENKKKYDKELKSATKSYTLAKSAQQVLTAILEKDSKAKAVEDFVRSNHTTIVNIFKKIHSPNEFNDINFDKTPGEERYCIKLYRNGTKKWVPLSEVSTGQRSALALSVFLALNLRVTGGPRLLLIDDPVAHVDDLNTLSFLDYLREIVVKDKRQVFFATASRKLASLFEMKFSDLEGFPLEVHRLKR